MQTIHNKINKLFYNWLLVSLFMVVCMIVVGGLTRLTNSGLSITEWELFSGILPPLKKETWDNYFFLYKQIPQFKLLNSDMTLEQFRIIFYWEYFHRILGRLIGLFFLIPLVIFHFSKKINIKYLSTCYLILFLIIIQGFVGWYMVSSGLVIDTTVSHYRLSLHLSIAFLITVLIFWLIINFKNNTFKLFFNDKRGNYLFYILIFSIFFQVVIGAFVSGLDAGKIYQTWPLMNYTYFPNDLNITNFKDFFNFENHSLVQFYHRNIAYLIVIYILFLGFFILKNKIKKIIKAYYLLFSLILVQVFLGIITLLSDLNIYVASAHQLTSLLLVLSAINLYYCHLK